MGRIKKITAAKKLIVACVLAGVFFGLNVFASQTDGAINEVNRYAWSENAGWIDFGTKIGDVHVLDTALTGYAWGENIGWISLNCSDIGSCGTVDFRVANDGRGNLSGYAWSENSGWIDFKPKGGGVVVNGSGEFSGYAWGENLGWVVFGCETTGSCGTVEYGMATDWRPESEREQCGNDVCDGGETCATCPGDCGKCHASESSVPPQETAIGGEPVEDEVLPPGPAGDGPADPKNGQFEAEDGVAVKPPKTPPPKIITESGKSEKSGPKADQKEPEEKAVFEGEAVIVKGQGATKGKPVLPSLLEEFLVAPFMAVVGHVDRPEVVTTVKAVSELGALAGGISSIASFVFTNPISLSESQFLPLRLLNLFTSFLGLRKKRRPWGTVYDSVTKRPLDPVYVSLVDAATGKEVKSAITDLDGRYGFLVVPGRYKVVPHKVHYSFPSGKMAGKSYDELYANLYFGGDIIVEKEDDVITNNIPMDPLSFDWNEFVKAKKGLTTFTKEKDILWAAVSERLFWIGFAAAIFSLFLKQAHYNYLILGIYAAIYLLNYFGLGTRKVGFLREKGTKIPLSYAIVRIFYAGQENEVANIVADKDGKYYCILGKGKYNVEIDKKNDDASYSTVFKSGEIDIKNGIFNNNFEI